MLREPIPAAELRLRTRQTMAIGSAAGLLLGYSCLLVFLDNYAWGKPHPVPALIVGLLGVFALAAVGLFRYSREKMEQGSCFNCDALMPLDAPRCPRCADTSGTVVLTPWLFPTGALLFAGAGYLLLAFGSVWFVKWFLVITTPGIAGWLRQYLALEAGMASGSVLAGAVFLHGAWRLARWERHPDWLRRRVPAVIAVALLALCMVHSVHLGSAAGREALRREGWYNLLTRTEGTVHEYVLVTWATLGRGPRTGGPAPVSGPAGEGISR